MSPDLGCKIFGTLTIVTVIFMAIVFIFCIIDQYSSECYQQNKVEIEEPNFNYTNTSSPFNFNNPSSDYYN